MGNEEYESINGFIVCAYEYVEGNEKESYWVDSQNLYVHISEQDYNGKNWWMIEPFKPILIKLDDFDKDSVKWFVTDTSVDSDYDKEWDFNKHKPF